MSLTLAAGAVSAQEVVVKVGVAGPLTGSGAAYGKDIENGVRMAIDEANAEHHTIGGKPVKFVMESQDDQGDPRVGVQAAQQLVDDNVSVVVGHFNSGTTLPASKIYAKAGIPMITPAATNPTITQSGLNTIYRVIATDSQNAGNAGQYAATVTKAKRIAIIDDRTAFGQGEADEFEKAVKSAGGSIVAREFTNDKAVDFSAQLTAIKSTNPDLVFFGGLDAQAAMLVKRMRQLGMKAQFLAGGGVMDANFIRLAGSAADGSSVWEYGQPLSTLAKGKTFESRFKQKFGTDMLSYAPFAYDATWVAIKAMEAANSVKPADFNAALKSTNYDGVTGKIGFTQTGDLKNPRSTMYQVKDVTWVPITTRSAD
ncbi:branched-chain amino acid ABC transporter substrate-binding protein [Paraburkholderia sp. SEWSISQ10-3 4]|uniref:branched-chain amino acid ABC transporter substrate-binding protein n=1 Tax=Paraburkholderia TaxID=1822464 RepID=UPI001F2254EA|nr:MULTISPECIES: branched-chain amino acid ABC transporter substrate-binding protein [Paraburkholderia]MCX4140282.1 branched-chain amino acid ABC transporter substrate-binding protein [Paraburkholderia aspalathi]MDN7172969.1 branched-chain amino acid ABC transporter substrate-binding protein [Paraburkholderia sp. SEWSISQ10-3 4]MDQ6502608.1 branched-chain amino acid ABC transporter substrate-binding protein [Paraburkholderia aspalathi]